MDLDMLRATQFPQLREGVVYADWTGAALPPVSLIDAHRDLLRDELLGNPHSPHQSSRRATGLVEAARAAVLAYFNADPTEYEVIFTSGASAAILLLQHFIWEDGELLLSSDNHNSVNGLREIARRNGAVYFYSPLTRDLRLDEEALRSRLQDPLRPQSRGFHLFAYPAKSNYSGVRHPLEWVQEAQELGWRVLLDAAAFLANDPLDLSLVKPDFIPVSFYKLFGFPTGVGCLVIKRGSYNSLDKRWFAGGAIQLVSVGEDFHAHEATGYARFEDGSVNFGMIPAIAQGLKFLGELHGRKEHAVGLANTLRQGLATMGTSGRSILVHSPEDTDVVTFSVVEPGGQHLNPWAVVEDASQAGIHLRAGCFCNPGCNERVFGYKVRPYVGDYVDRIGEPWLTPDTIHARLGNQPFGAIRASFGYANSPEDASRILAFFRDYVDRP